MLQRGDSEESTYQLSLDSRPRTHSVEGISRAKIKSVKQTVVIIAGYVACSTPAVAVQMWAVWAAKDEEAYGENWSR